MGVNGTMRFKLKTARNLFMLCLLMAVVYIMMFKIDTEIDCYKFCLRETCFGSRLAILVYRTDVKPKEMDFLQNYRPKIGYYKYAADHMSGEYDPETCSMEEHFSQFTTIPPQNNCAVVGNGGILLHSSCGAEINAYDYVIRMNLAPLRGYEEDVGVRTDLTLLNFETLVYLHSNLTQRAMGDRLHDMYVNRVWYLNDSVLWYGKSMGPRETRKRLQQSVDVLKTTYQLPIRIAYSWRPLHPEKFIHLDSFATSGFNAYYVAQSLCKHVTLYGFYPSSKDKRGYHLPHHYHEDVPYEYNNRVHNLLSEFEKFKEFEAEGKVRIVTDKCAEGGRAMPRWRDGEEHEKPLGDLLWFKRNKP